MVRSVAPKHSRGGRPNLESIWAECGNRGAPAVLGANFRLRRRPRPPRRLNRGSMTPVPADGQSSGRQSGRAEPLSAPAKCRTTRTQSLLPRTHASNYLRTLPYRLDQPHHAVVDPLDASRCGCLRLPEPANMRPLHACERSVSRRIVAGSVRIRSGAAAGSLRAMCCAGRAYASSPRQCQGVDDGGRCTCTSRQLRATRAAERLTVHVLPPLTAAVPLGFVLMT